MTITPAGPHAPAERPPPGDTRIAAPAGTPAPHGYSAHRAEHLHRLHRIEGQVRGIARMVDEDRYCLDVPAQVTAATRALQQVALGLLDDHLRHCVVAAARADPDIAEARLRELGGTLRQALRL